MANDQNIELEKATFEDASMKGGLEPLQEEDYAYFYGMVRKKYPVPGKIKVLEVGCGSGAFGIRLAKIGYNVTGLDISKVLIDAARINAKKNKVKYRALVADVTTYKVRGYDAVICGGFLHHFTDLAMISEKLGKFLKKGGRVIFVEPNGSNPAVSFTENIRKNVWPFSKMGSLGTANETSHTVSSYRKHFAQAGFMEDEIVCFVKRPKFGDYGLILNVILRLKYYFHAFVSMLMPKGIRGTVVVASFRKMSEK